MRLQAQTPPGVIETVLNGGGCVGALRPVRPLVASRMRENASTSKRSGDELKLVYPQAAAPPERFEVSEFSHFFLQPMDGPERDANTSAAVKYCLDHPQWRLSLQTHKYLGIP